MADVKLLLVDDEADFREATSRALGRRGFRVETAESGARALELLQRTVPDIIVLDLRMEGMDGITTLRELRKQNEEIPVVILTGHGQLDDAVAGFHLGIVEFLQKPVEVVELAERLRALLDGGRCPPLRERRVEEVMVPARSYRSIYIDRPLRELVSVLVESLIEDAAENSAAPGVRTVVVRDRADKFVGCVRPGDVLDALLPAALRDSPYSSYLTGMFLGQCKLVGQRTVADILEEPAIVDVDVPLMEAVHVMVSRRVVSLPVLRNGELVGVLRDKDLLLEAARCMRGDRSGPTL